MSMAFEEISQVAAKGEEIYRQRYQKAFERLYPNQFVAIDVLSQQAFIGEYPDVAIGKAFDEVAQPHIHLVKIGCDSAYSMGSMLT